jgi:hypothetical protein
MEAVEIMEGEESRPWMEPWGPRERARRFVRMPSGGRGQDHGAGNGGDGRRKGGQTSASEVEDLVGGLHVEPLHDLRGEFGDEGGGVLVGLCGPVVLCCFGHFDVRVRVCFWSFFLR